MDAFEVIAGLLLENDKYWVRHSVKVNLTKEEKVKIKKPSTPRPEIDIVAFDTVQNILFLLEAKSFLDSGGVVYEKVVEKNEFPSGRYKILTSEKYQKIIVSRLKTDWIAAGIINKKTKFRFGLVAGNVYQNKEADLKKYFDDKKWFFWGPADLKQKLIVLSKKGYENSIVTIVTKLMLKKTSP
jgi:hypothetical protein